MYMLRAEVLMGELIMNELLISSLNWGLAKGRKAVLLIIVDWGLTYCMRIFLLQLGDKPLFLGESKFL